MIDGWNGVLVIEAHGFSTMAAKVSGMAKKHSSIELSPGTPGYKVFSFVKICEIRG